MANTVYTVEDVTLQDDTTVTLRPLNIKNLRKFMKQMDKFTKIENEDEGVDIIVDASALCISGQRPEFYDASKHNGLGGATDAYEEIMDMETAYRILEICGGVKLNDPKLLAAAAEAAEAQQASLGMN